MSEGELRDYIQGLVNPGRLGWRRRFAWLPIVYFEGDREVWVWLSYYWERIQ